ncbi:hypothetical protein AUW17_02440 [Tenacibaculum dicentrarchi]|nr:hypothetical protein AUW17_02440 [Tenacibaculum dicentrarchi]
MELFPAFRTRFFCFFKRKKQKRAQTIASIGARGFCYILKTQNDKKKHSFKMGAFLGIYSVKTLLF